MDDSLLETLKLVEQDDVWWARSGSSPAYTAHVLELKQLIRLGLVIVKPDGGCFKYYLITQKGANVLQNA